MEVYTELSQLFLVRIRLSSYWERGVWCGSRLERWIAVNPFGSKQSMNPVDLPSTCHPSLSLTTFAFRSREAKPLLSDPDSYVESLVSVRLR